MATASLRTKAWHQLGHSVPWATQLSVRAAAAQSKAPVKKLSAISLQHGNWSRGCPRGHKTRVARMESKQEENAVAPATAPKGAKFASGKLPSYMIQSVVPQTLVPPPLFQNIFSKPMVWFKWLKIRVWTRGANFLQRRGLWMASKPTWLTKARFKPSRRALIPTAKALHRSMSEAFARGDRETLYKIMTRDTYQTMATSIEKRKPGRKGIRREWELIKYTKTWLYPRVVDHKCAMLPTGVVSPEPMIEQAVVAIASRQRLIEYDDLRAGVVMPGSEKVVDVIDNVVMVRTLHGGTYQPDEWRLVGTMDETVLENWEEEAKILKKMAAQSNLKGR